MSGVSVAEWTWTSPSGVERNLSTGCAYLGVGGVTGHMAAPVSVIASTPPTIDGGIYRSHRFEPRDIGLRILVKGATVTEWRDNVRSLVNDFDTSGGAGTLQVGHVDGQRRSLDCRYLSGLEAPDGGDPGPIPFGAFTVLVRAFDPWWYGPTQVRTFEVSTGDDFFPFPPITLNPTELVGSGSTITNPGDVAAYPVWTINGPATAATFTLGSASFTITHTLSAGEYVTVDTDPRTSAFQKIVDDGGTNLWGTATSNYPNLWALPAGDSPVTVSMSGTGTGSSVRLAFQPRYRSA